MKIKAINPTTGETVREYEEISPQAVKSIINKSNEAWLAWKETGMQTRADLMKKVARLLRGNVDYYARIMAEEMGKPIKGGRSEMEKCARVCDYYAEHAEKFLEQEIITTDAGKSFVTFQPLGVVLAVMPWNFPFWQVFRFAAPGLMAGNAIILKHSSNVPGCALAIEEIFRQAGFAPNIFTTLLVLSNQVESIIENPLVKGITLTGSTEAGRAVAKKAGEMIKKTVLELGGSDPYLILQDADLETAATVCAESRLINSGQSCIAAKRFIVVESRREQFEKLMVRRMESVKIGNPLEENTTIGPLARLDLRDQLHRQVLKSIAQGANRLLGGRIPDGKGFFYPPTVLGNVGKGMPAYHQELFGPVAAIISVKDEDEAIRVANDSEFGLGAAIFTEDAARGEKIAAQKINAGCCFVNALVKSDPRLPFGGLKESGYGRELSHYGIKEFVNIKTVFVR